MTDYANILKALNKFEAAEHFYKQALDQSVITLGENHGDTLWAAYHLARFLAERQQLDEAAKLPCCVREHWTAIINFSGRSIPAPLLAKILNTIWRQK